MLVKSIYSIEGYRESKDRKAEEKSSADFFTQSEDVLFGYRHRIQHGHLHYYCGYCGEELKICGGGETKQRLHFRHKNQDKNRQCIYIEENHPTRREIERFKYGNKEEGIQHQYIKNTIATLLEKKGFNVYIEQWIKNEQEPRHPRRPDIRAISTERNIDIVIEIQLTTTFVDVILGRNDFYRKRKMYILWVFYDLKNNFTQKDVFYDNEGYENLFLFDENAKEKSIRNNELYLTCLYIKYDCNPDTGEIEREKNFTSELIKFDDLKFDREKNVIYYYSPINAKEQLKEKQRAIQCEIERKKQEETRIYSQYLKEELARLEQEQKQKIEEQKREEARRKAEEEQRRKRNAELAEEERIEKLRKDLQIKLSAYLYSETTLKDLLTSYQNAEQEVKKLFGWDVVYEIKKHTASNECYKYSIGEDSKLIELIDECSRLNVIIDWEYLCDIPVVVLNNEHHISYMVQHITIDLYANHQYHLPQRYKDILKYRIEKCCDSSVNGIEWQELEDEELLLICCDRISDSSLDKCYYNVVNNDETYKYLRSMFSIYIGQTIGEDRRECNNRINSRVNDAIYKYQQYYTKLLNPYYHLFKRLLEYSERRYGKSAFIQCISNNKKYIERMIKDNLIEERHNLDALMPVLFPDIQWGLQQSLF